jgi:hypothetical protein
MNVVMKALSERGQAMALSNRYQVKRFKTSDAMHKFLNQQTDNSWYESPHDLKSGTYFSQMDREGVRYLNVKLLAF